MYTQVSIQVSIHSFNRKHYHLLLSISFFLSIAFNPPPPPFLLALSSLSLSPSDVFCRERGHQLAGTSSPPCRYTGVMFLAPPEIARTYLLKS